MDEKTIETYFEVFSASNYPTFFYGSKGQLVLMMTGCMLRKLPTLITNPKMFKYM